jgi:hypothetical protein
MTLSFAVAAETFANMETRTSGDES